MPEKEISVCEEKVYEQLYHEHAEKICYCLYYKYGDFDKKEN